MNKLRAVVVCKNGECRISKGSNAIHATELSETVYNDVCNPMTVKSFGKSQFLSPSLTKTQDTHKYFDSTVK